MKSTFQAGLTATLLASGFAAAQSPTYSNFIRQTQYPSGVQWDATVAVSGSRLSDLAIDPGGAKFDLWTVKSIPLTDYLLSSVYVGTYIPLASISVTSEDTTGIIPRTRADKPFTVTVTVDGLLNGATDPEPSKSVKFLRHVQSYGVNGDGINIDRTQATLLTQSSLNSNGTQVYTFALSSVPGGNRSKIRGEERFSIYSLEDYQAPESQIDSKFIQVWPVADGTIAGIAQDELVKATMPQLTFTVNDIYPGATIYAQIYKGNPALGTTGEVIEGSAWANTSDLPANRTHVIPGENYDTLAATDGRYTIELLTSTPFGIDRLAYVSFDVNRMIEVNGTFTTIE